MDPQQIPLRDLHLPDPTGWWPLAPGWWFLIALALAGLGYLLRNAWLDWRRNAPRRLALRELARLRGEYERGVDIVTFARELSELLRRAMLACAPRAEVAGLTGARWLEWLDRGLDDRPFSDGPGRVLISLPYRGADPEEGEFDLDLLTDVVQKRLSTRLPESLA